MKLKELRPVIFSSTGRIQFCIIYDRSNNVDLENGCSIEYAYKNYGEREVMNVSATYENDLAQLVFTII